MWGEAGTELNWPLDPLEALRRWPAARPVAMLHSGRLHPRWSRWSILAEPAGAYRFTTRSEWIDHAPRPASAASYGSAFTWAHEPFTDLEQVIADRSALWIGYLSYDLGRFIEVVPARARTDRDWPVVQMHRCPGWLVHDGLTGRWTAHGTWRDHGVPHLDDSPAGEAPFEATVPQPLVARDTFEAAVQRVIDYIAAGDVFQVNLAQRFTATWRGQPRTLYRRLAHHSPAWYGAYIECLGLPGEPRRTLASTSPELFLEIDGGGRIVTRPIKGTRPGSATAKELEISEKDIAELNMIVDLLRNDLGRVGRFGSVRVEAARVIESHPTVHHGVATISARLRDGQGLSDLLRAAMPGGSVTGAPKIRAMQIIEELEPVRRGPYCGAIGVVHGQEAVFNLAIRTMLLESQDDAAEAGHVDFSVGGGIVADSNPQAEYQETLDKAAAMMAALRNPG